jgi:hypothetical protein
MLRLPRISTPRSEESEWRLTAPNMIPVELMEIKRQLVALTNRLTGEQKNQYQDRRIAAEAEAIAFKSRLENRTNRK